MDEEKFTKGTTRWRCATILLCVVCLLLVVIIIGLYISKNKEIESSRIPICGSAFTANIDTSEPAYPGVFHDLTQQELKDVQDYLKSVPELNLTMNSDNLNSSVIDGIDYIVPNKADVLAYLDSSGPKPTRKAKVIILRGDLTPAKVEEYEVQPVPNPTSHKLIDYPNRRNPVPFAVRPFTRTEFRVISNIILKKIDDEIGDILLESYEATFLNCGKRCLFFVPNVASSAVLGDFSRKMWLQVTYLVEFYTLHPVDLMIYVNMDGTDPSKFEMEKIVYGGQFRNTLQELANDYKAGTIRKSQFKFPVEDAELFSTVHKRASPAKKVTEQRPPSFFEPDGPRYKIKHRAIEYMNWKLNIRMSTYKGPQVHNIRFAEERIAYEVGLQEIAVFYSANAPTFRTADYVDSVAALGTRARSLVPGIDCPETATYLSTQQVDSHPDGSVKYKRSFCVFELNTGYPLKRHMEYYQERGGFYGGMVDSCLVVRTILTLNNYDYIIDYIFHQSGIMETKVISTGYVYAGFYDNQESEYGFQIQDRLLGVMHHHLFHFKVDLDIFGTSNRYETLDIKLVNVSNSKWLNGLDTVQTQIKFDRNLKNTELEAAYKYNFDTPKEHIFHNNDVKSEYGVPRAFKIQHSGMTKQLLPEDKLNERTIPWARYQMAVTKHKDAEECSSSIYATFDGLDPVVNFTQFLADDENIVDEDLVAWLSLGLYHIPVSEDLPLTQTPGKHLSFTLSPHNYYTEDPSVSSKDQIRLQLKDKSNPSLGVNVQRYFNSSNKPCVSSKMDLEKDVYKTP